MKNLRSVSQIIPPQSVIDGAGVHLRRSFGPNQANPFDPFLLLDNFSFKDPKEGPISGFPTHPHRGIETVTYMLDGMVRHRDSMGLVDTIGPGDVQWMTAGRGILHEEMPRRGESGIIDGFQLWVNLPADQKMVSPRYQGVLSNAIPTVTGEGTSVRVIAGEFDGTVGPVKEIAADPVYLDVLLEANSKINIPVTQGHTVITYLYEGEAVFGADQEFVAAPNLVVFTDGDHIEANTGTVAGARFLVMAGAPFGEPIFPYGPFVMNTREEIIQALDDLRNGTFVEGENALEY